LRTVRAPHNAGVCVSAAGAGVGGPALGVPAAPAAGAGVGGPALGAPAGVGVSRADGEAGPPHPARSTRPHNAATRDARCTKANLVGQSATKSALASIQATRSPRVGGVGRPRRAPSSRNSMRCVAPAAPVGTRTDRPA